MIVEFLINNIYIFFFFKCALHFNQAHDCALCLGSKRLLHLSASLAFTNTKWFWQDGKREGESERVWLEWGLFLPRPTFLGGLVISLIVSLHGKLPICPSPLPHHVSFFFFFKLKRGVFFFFFLRVNLRVKFIQISFSIISFFFSIKQKSFSPHQTHMRENLNLFYPLLFNPHHFLSPIPWLNDT